MVALPDQYLSVDDYLRLEAESPIKHEYNDFDILSPCRQIPLLQISKHKSQRIYKEMV